MRVPCPILVSALALAVVAAACLPSGSPANGRLRSHMHEKLSAAAARVDPPAPVLPVPTPRQLAWFEREMIAFVHFGVNTFTDREWGDGKEDPAIFNPTQLDARQWARACRDGGLKMIVLTAKHHDGFCLWPSKYTDHSVASGPWKGGKGDVVREVADACREAGLDFGVYLSPWDRHEPSYGDSPRYNDHYLKQLTELLTDYGKVSELWFDGACGEGPNGRKQVYDFDAYWGLVRKLAPDACMFSDVGPDVRWVGNESGYASDPNWSTIDRSKMGIGRTNPDQTHGLYAGPDFIPTEVNTSIRPGWFYHAAEDDKVKPLAQLLDNYYASVGMNGVYMLNIPPDRRGLFHENDVARLREFREAIDATFREDLARGRSASATNTRGNSAAFAPAAALDGDPATYWATDDGVTAASLEVDLGRPAAFSRAVFQEHIALGQRVKAFSFEALVDGEWKELAKGRTLGRKRILRFPAVRAAKVRLNILDARACPTISALGLYLAPPEVTVSPDARGFLASETLRIALSSDVPGAEIRYTLDGSDPTPSSPAYKDPIPLRETTTVKARAFVGPQRSLRPAVATFRALRPEDLRPAETAADAKPGLRYAYFEGGWQSLRDMVVAKPVDAGTVADFDIGVRKRDEHFALRFEGYVDVPRDGIYRFFTRSDDGSMLFIGDALIVDNDGLHGTEEEKGGEVALKAGRHAIAVTYFNATGGKALQVGWQGPELSKQLIPAAALSRRE